MTSNRYEHRVRPLHPFDELIKQIVGDQTWKDRAACKGLDVTIFYPERGANPNRAQPICGECPVQQQCQDFAIDNDEQHGIWGGVALRKRRKIAKTRQTHTHHITDGDEPSVQSA
jgi:WhiB family transcriptional regulator, redox-sensing transcriptional regulator